MSIDTAPFLTNEKLHRLLLVLGLLTGAILLLIFPLAKPLWTDEILNIQWGAHSLDAIIHWRANARDHTPLQALTFWILRSKWGDNVSVYRWFSTFPAVVSLWVVYLLGRRVNKTVGVLAVWLAALAPGIVLFDRMARYHGTLTLLTTLSVYLLLKALDTGRRRDTIAYALATTAMLLVYVPSIFVVAGQFVILVARWREEKYRWNIIAGMAFAVACFAPVIWMMLHWSGSSIGETGVEDAKISQGISGFILRFGLPVYVFCVGETIYPWVWAASIPGILAVLSAFLAGVWYLRKRADLVVPATCALSVLLFAIVLSGKLGMMQTSGSMAKRASFVIPLFCVTLAAGIYSLRPPVVRVGVAGVIFLVWIYSLNNYWTGQQFLNQNYTASWNEVFARLEKDDFAHDSVMITSESVIQYYARRKYTTLPLVDSGRQYDAEKVTNDGLLKATQEGRRYVYFIGRDRGSRGSVMLGDEICNILSRRYKCDQQIGFMPRTESEKHWLSLMLKRPTSPYYIWLARFDLSQPASSGAPK